MPWLAVLALIGSVVFAFVVFSSLVARDAEGPPQTSSVGPAAAAPTPQSVAPACRPSEEQAEYLLALGNIFVVIGAASEVIDEEFDALAENPLLLLDGSWGLRMASALGAMRLAGANLVSLQQPPDTEDLHMSVVRAGRLATEWAELFGLALADLDEGLLLEASLAGRELIAETNIATAHVDLFCP